MNDFDRIERIALTDIATATGIRPADMAQALDDFETHLFVDRHDGVMDNAPSTLRDEEFERDVNDERVESALHPYRAVPISGVVRPIDELGFPRHVSEVSEERENNALREAAFARLAAEEAKEPAMPASWYAKSVEKQSRVGERATSYAPLHSLARRLHQRDHSVKEASKTSSEDREWGINHSGVRTRSKADLRGWITGAADELEPLTSIEAYALRFGVGADVMELGLGLGLDFRAISDRGVLFGSRAYDAIAQDHDITTWMYGRRLGLEPEQMYHVVSTFGEDALELLVGTQTGETHLDDGTFVDFTRVSAEYTPQIALEALALVATGVTAESELVRSAQRALVGLLSNTGLYESEDIDALDVALDNRVEWGSVEDRVGEGVGDLVPIYDVLGEGDDAGRHLIEARPIGAGYQSTSASTIPSTLDLRRPHDPDAVIPGDLD